MNPYDFYDASAHREVSGYNYMAVAAQGLKYEEVGDGFVVR